MLLLSASALRYLQRKGYRHTPLNFSRLQLSRFKTHRKVIAIPILAKKRSTVAAGSAEIWPDVVE